MCARIPRPLGPRRRTPQPAGRDAASSAPKWRRSPASLPKWPGGQRLGLPAAPAPEPIPSPPKERRCSNRRPASLPKRRRESRPPASSAPKFARCLWPARCAARAAPGRVVAVEPFPHQPPHELPHRHVRVNVSSCPAPLCGAPELGCKSRDAHIGVPGVVLIKWPESPSKYRGANLMGGNEEEIPLDAPLVNRPRQSYPARPGINSTRLTGAGWLPRSCRGRPPAASGLTILRRCLILDLANEVGSTVGIE